MDRSSKAITLALIGSAFLLGGCNRQQEEEEWNAEANTETNQSTGRHGGGGIFIAPRIGGGLGGGGGGMGMAPSARGGFGATGSSGLGGAAS